MALVKLDVSQIGGVHPLKQENDMMVFNGALAMSPNEWTDFQRITYAPWPPRTPEEFDAMCDLGAARHKAENTNGKGRVHAGICRLIKFSPGGEMNFPVDVHRLAYAKVCGTLPDAEQLYEFESLPRSDPGLRVVK